MNQDEFISVAGCHPKDILWPDWENIISEWNCGSIKIKW